MKKCYTMITLFISSTLLLFAETNALIEVHFFKTWAVEGEWSFYNLAIKNTGTEPILLAKRAFDFSGGQLFVNKANEYPKLERDHRYREIALDGEGFFNLLPEETHVYEGRRFYLTPQASFSEKMHFTISVYLGNDFWLNSEPLTINMVVPDSAEQLTTIANNKLARQNKNLHDTWYLVVISYKNERWLYKKSITSNNCYPICPLSLTNKIRVEPYNDETLFKIWDGDKSMLYDMYKNTLIEGSDEHNVLGKWTRERKQQAEAENAEVRRRKAEQNNNQ